LASAAVDARTASESRAQTQAKARENVNAPSFPPSVENPVNHNFLSGTNHSERHLLRHRLPSARGAHVAISVVEAVIHHRRRERFDPMFCKRLPHFRLERGSFDQGERIRLSANRRAFAAKATRIAAQHHR
jgi:hypothetical protein